MRKKWAGTNLNRGYGHPKAEGYQATPPARMLTKAVRSFNLSESWGSVARRRVELPPANRYVTPRNTDHDVLDSRG